MRNDEGCKDWEWKREGNNGHLLGRGGVTWRLLDVQEDIWELLITVQEENREMEENEKTDNEEMVE